MKITNTNLYRSLPFDSALAAKAFQYKKWPAQYERTINLTIGLKDSNPSKNKIS